MSQKSLPGFRDFYPEQCAERSHIFDAWRRIVRRYSFVEYDGPPLESLELYTQKSGEEIVTQLYAFTDKGGREVALRPEMTPTFSRMVSARAQALRKPVRWFSTPQLFRYERTQKGRLREHFQLNVDIVGEADILADAELLAVAIDIMRELGLTARDVAARVSDRRLLNALLEHFGIPVESHDQVYAVLDKLERQPVEISREKLTDAGIAPAVTEELLSFATLGFDEAVARYGGSEVVAPHLENFRQYREHLNALGVGDWLRFDLTIVRGLAYYTGFVFELFDAQGDFRAICGGGRYDNLLGALGGVSLPAVGFGMGDVVLGELLRARGLMDGVAVAGPELWLVPGEDFAPQDVVRLAGHLRSLGFSVEYTLNFRKLGTRRTGQQLSDATKAHARAALVCRNMKQVDVIQLGDSESGDTGKDGFSFLADFDTLMHADKDSSCITGLRRLLQAGAVTL